MLKDWQNFFSGKSVTVMGLGLLGRGIGDVKFLAKYCKEVLVTDLKTETELQTSIEEIGNLPNVKFVLGKHDLKDFEERDFILKAAGVPLNSPFIAHARERGIPIYMDEALFVKLAPEIITVGITGTRGKTTTTMMIYEILKAAGKKVLLGGNIKGVATLPFLEEVEKDSILVMELSSWQLQGFGDLKISPNVSVFTNFYDDHLNYYGGDKHLYFYDKSFIFKNQKQNDTIIFGEHLEEVFKKEIFESLGFKKPVICEDLKLIIPGTHNIENANLAIAATETLGVDKEFSKKVLESFSGVEGRLQFIREVNGIKFWNDTTSTTPVAAINAIDSLYTAGKNLILIMGGADKNLDMTKLVSKVKEKVSSIIFLPGTGTEKLLQTESFDNFIKVNNMSQAVLEAREQARSGDNIVMSPAYASFGLFKNEFDRGEQFDAAVKSL